MFRRSPFRWKKIQETLSLIAESNIRPEILPDSGNRPMQVQVHVISGNPFRFCPIMPTSRGFMSGQRLWRILSLRPRFGKSNLPQKPEKSGIERMVFLRSHRPAKT
jgi:hypothetical protein